MHRRLVAIKRTAQAPLAQPRTVEMLPLSLRADVVAQTIDEAARSVELVFSTGAPVERYDWMSGTRYIETLSLEEDAVKIDRINAGGPLLDAHSSYSVFDQIGAVVPGSVSITKREARATVRFSKREAVEPVWQDVRDGIIRSVSVGYRVHRFEETAGVGNKLPVRKAVSWEPFEISLVPIAADAGARVRKGGDANTNPCEIVPAGLAARAAQTAVITTETVITPKEKPMDPDQEDVRSEFVVEDSPLAPTPAQRAAAAPPVEPNDRDAGAAQENERIQGILRAVDAARLPRDFATKLIGDTKLSLVRAQDMVFKELAKRDRANDGPLLRPGDPLGDRGNVGVGDDPIVHERAGIENALLHRAAPALRDKDGKQKFPLEEVGRKYRGMGLMDIARVLLHGRGIRTSHMSKLDIAGAALNLRGGMHTTSDFALLLADVQGKVLRAAYEEAPQTWQRLMRTVTLSDFKPSKQLQLGDAPSLLEVLEHGEFTRGTVAEAKEQFQLSTYGRIFSITRQSIINDDTDAFSRIPIEFGRAARRVESDLAWKQITDNANMGDGVALFHATHNNLSATSDAIAVASIGAGRSALRVQKGIDGASLMNLAPRYLIVPASKETIADQFVSTLLTASAPGSINPFAGRLEVISEPRLDANSVTAWYLSASPDQIDILLHGVLEGQEGPTIETRVGFDVDGVEIKARLDVAFKIADFRGLWKNPGA